MSVSQTLDVSETSYSVADNTSKVRIIWKSTQSGTSYNGFTRTAYYYYSVNGGSEIAKTVSYTLPQNSTKTIVDTTLTVPHEPDGSGTIKVRTWMDTDISAGVIQKDSGTITLTTIPRKSTLSASNGELGKAQTLKATRKSDSFTHTLTWRCGAHKGTIATKSSAVSWTFTPSKELSKEAPYGSKVCCSFKLTTYNGKNAVGSDSKDVWYTIPSTIKPVCSLSLSDHKHYEKTYGGYIQGESMLDVTITATEAYDSPISQYSASVNGTTYSSSTFTTGVLKTDGEQVPISATVKDGRGRYGSASSTFKVLPYKRPRITNLKVHRCNSDGTANDLGAYCQVSFRCIITSLSNKNTKSCTLKYRQSGATNWTEAPAIPLPSYDSNCNPPVIAMSEEHSYEVIVTATDAFGSTNASTSVSTGYCLYHIPASGKGITFGGIAESDGFNVKMGATFGENVNMKKNLQLNGNVNGNYLTGTWLQSTASTDLGKTAQKVAVLDNNGWVYYRAPAELKADMGIATPADYVVEQGVSSNWHYQKWNSGLIKLWKKTTSSNLGAVQDGGVNGWYYRLYTITIPNGLLKTVTSAMCNCKWGTGLSFASAQEVTTTAFHAAYFSNQNGGAGTFYHEVTGTWR